MPIERERRLAKVAGACACLSVAATVAAVLVAAQGTTARGPGVAISRADQLHEVHTGATMQLAGAIIRAAALLLVLGVAPTLHQAIRRREPRTPRWGLWLAVAGPVLAAAAVIVGYLALRDVADQFAAGPLTGARADAAVDGSGALRATFWFERLANLVLGAWVTVAAVWGLRCGLLTRFVAGFGAIAGLATAVLPIGAGLLLGWLACIGALLWGWWPGGRPPAWAAGRSVPWPDGGRLFPT